MFLVDKIKFVNCNSTLQYCLFVIILLQLNCVVMRGMNEEEICDFVALTEHKVTVLWL